MGCHTFPVQHKNKTTKSHFSSEKNLNGCADFANACSRRTPRECEPGRPTPLYIKAFIVRAQEESLLKFRA
jgi:hypothetical protein